MSREAMKQALEALETVRHKIDSYQVNVCDDVDEAITAIQEALAQPEFVTHTVEQPDDWSEWVSPDPTGYLMKCCDCGLVHEAQFKVVRYKSDAEHEDCDPVDDPNVQAVFRMRRSEQWTPKDTAYRPGGLAQPEQRPVAWLCKTHERSELVRFSWETFGQVYPLYTIPPQRKPLTDEEITAIFEQFYQHDHPAGWEFTNVCRAIEAAHGIKE